MKFLVLGASGMAGHVISIYLQENGHQVTGYSRRQNRYVHFVIGDVRETEKLKKLVETESYDAVINAVGILNQHAEQDKEAALFINGYLPHYLAKITRYMKTKVIHISTDCVFSGKTGSYTEYSVKDGPAFYDRSKAVGELDDNKNLTLRNSIIGPDIDMNGIGLLNWFLQQDEADGYTDAVWTGLTTLQLAKVIEKACEEDASGLVNMVCNKSISKYELLKICNYYICNDRIKIRPFDKIRIDKSLIRTNFEFNYIVPDYNTMIWEMAEWIKGHMKLYPHYHLR